MNRSIRNGRKDLVKKWFEKGGFLLLK